MKVMAEDTKFAHLGKPGTAFSAGFARRLNIITSIVNFTDKKILDAGAGQGVWLEQFMQYTDPQNVYGFDIDAEEFNKMPDHVRQQIPADNLKVCPGEELDFADDMFDIVFSNEVLEHVVDDRKVVEETIRVLKRGGKFVVFTPNRGWPFETHGMFFRGKYYWGNIPLLPWLPKPIFKKFAPHVRNYSNRELMKLFKGLPVKVVYHKHVFPGFDGLVRRFGPVGKVIQRFMHLLEKTPLHFFGISHLLVVEKLVD